MVEAKVAVLGAGAVGVACALYLQREGHDVLLIDRDQPARGCSFGNAGLIQCSSVVPIAMPGILRAVPRMLLDPDQPLVIRWRHLLSLAPYLLHFMKEASASRAEANSRALAAIIPASFEAYLPLIEAAGIGDMVERSGELYVYETQAAFAAAASNRAMRRARCVEVQLLTGAEARELEPALSPAIERAVFLPNSYQTVNPYRFIAALARHFCSAGGRILQAEIRDVTPAGTGFTLMTDKGPVTAEQIVVALGAFSKPFAQRLGCNIPLDSERGYHLRLPAPGVTLKRAVLSGDYRFAMAPSDDAVVLAGTAELAKVGAPPELARARRLLPLARRLLPGLSADGGTVWMGHRPSTPDSLPVIGRSPHHGNAIFAFGHGHSGLTLAAVTGRIIADLVAERMPDIDLLPYRADRFH